MLASNFDWADPSTVATLHDRPFACITMGRTARKQGLKEVAAFSLNIPDSTIDVEYAFLKLREQLVSFQHSPVESLRAGLGKMFYQFICVLSYTSLYLCTYTPL